MVKLGKKQLYLPCSDATGTVSIYQPFSCSCGLSLMSLGTAEVLEFKERFSKKHFYSSVKGGQEQTFAIVVFEKVGA